MKTGFWFDCGAAAIFGCGVAEPVGVGVGEGDRDRLYFIWPNPNGASTKRVIAAIVTRLIIRGRCADSFRTSKRFCVSAANCKAKIVSDSRLVAHFHDPKPYCQREGKKVQPGCVVPAERRMLDCARRPGATWNQAQSSENQVDDDSCAHH